MQFTKLNPRGWLCFQNLLVCQLMKKFSTFYGTRRSITLSNKPANCPYPEPDESIPIFSLFWDITHRTVIHLYRRFGTTYKNDK
jgi:hypothetical protein